MLPFHQVNPHADEKEHDEPRDAQADGSTHCELDNRSGSKCCTIRGLLGRRGCQNRRRFVHCRPSSGFLAFPYDRKVYSASLRMITLIQMFKRVLASPAAEKPQKVP